MIAGNIIERARKLDQKINKKIQSLPVMSLETYLFFIYLVFFLAGFGFMMYFVLYGLNPLNVSTLSSPLFYLVMGLVMFCAYLCKKHKPK